jgi:hypothetical protein
MKIMSGKSLAQYVLKPLLMLASWHIPTFAEYSEAVHPITCFSLA